MDYLQMVEEIKNEYNEEIGDMMAIPEHSLLVTFDLTEIDEADTLRVEEANENMEHEYLYRVDGLKGIFHVPKPLVSDEMPYDLNHIKWVFKLISSSNIVKNISVKYPLDKGKGFAAKSLKNSYDDYIIDCITILKSAKSLAICAFDPNKYADERIKSLLSKFSELEEFMVIGGLQSFPNKNEVPPSLKVAYFDYIGAKSLKKILENLPLDLEMLVITCTYFEKLPDEIGRLINLKYLEISSAYYFDGVFPESFKNLKQLEYLNISDNLLCSFPEIIFDIADNLKYISIE